MRGTLASAGRDLQLREPDSASGRRAFRRPRQGGRRRRRAAFWTSRSRRPTTSEHAGQAGIDTILLLSPTTTDDRLKKAAALGSGFLYAISPPWGHRRTRSNCRRGAVRWSNESGARVRCQ
jgi:hypothetical protein